MFKPRSDRPKGRFGDKKPSRGGPAGEGRGPRDERGGGGRFFRKKTCRFCADHQEFLDFKDGERLARFLTEKGKIVPRRITGNCAKHQRILARALKRARHAAILAFQIE